MFLTLNGHRLVEQGDRIYKAMIAIGTHRLDKSGLAQVFRECSATDE